MTTVSWSVKPRNMSKYNHSDLVCARSYFAIIYDTTTQHCTTLRNRNFFLFFLTFLIFYSCYIFCICPVFSGGETRVPAKCLICGKWLCCEAWCCKETVGDQSVGSCTAHALTCGAGIGIFLRVRDCIVLLLNGIGKGCFYASPYLDAYGETDTGLR
jgi:hypothetical protein